MLLASRLRLALANRSQADAAKALGVNQSTVSDWCNGMQIPSNTKIAALARFLNIPDHKLGAMLARDRVTRHLTKGKS